MIWMKDGIVKVYVMGEKVEAFEMVSCINRRTTVLKFQN